ncbi:MAG: hypothetical protein GKR93_10525 [Gammaproteobacteria bacterium]|nr:hypothetical protein [Gammaproteobacteria bacterium]
MKFITHIGLLIGLLLLIALLIWQGALDVVRLIFTSGWSLLWLPLVWLPSFLPATEGWRVLLRSRKQPTFRHAIMAMWMGRAVNNLLPVASIGGEIAKARLISLWGISGIDAAASVMVDKVVQAISVVIWGLTGVCILLFTRQDNELAVYALIGFLIVGCCAIGFLYAQKAGLLSILTRLGGKLIKTDIWKGVSLNAKEIDGVIAEMYRNMPDILAGVFFRTVALILETAEVILACYLFGHPISLLEAMMLKSLTATLRDIAFVIPNGYGIQEGAYIVVGSLVGLDANTALAVALALRIRDLLLDPAGLLYFHQIEARQFSKSKPA